MFQTTLTVKDGIITLPKKLKKAWGNTRVFVLPSEDTLYLKKVEKPSLEELEPKLRKLGRLISQKDIDNAVKWARK